MNSKLNERFVRHTAVPRAQVYPFVLALAFLFAACSNYQEEFDNNFGALEYVDDVDYSSPSGGDDPLPSSSDGNNPSSSSVPTSSGDIQSSSSSEDDNPSSSSVPISSGDIQSSSSVIATSSSQAVQSSSSIASSSSSAESSSSYVPPSGRSYGIMTDPRTSTFSYRTVEIGGRTWMAENMAWQTTVSFCYGEDSHNCKNYGRLYSWEDAKNLCPDGWSLPRKEEWEELIKSVGGGGSANQAGKALKTISGWKNDGNGTDEYGFSALPAGYRSNDGTKYYGLGGAAHFWSATATESGSNSAYGLKLENSVDSAWMSKYSVTGEYYYALSVRCILDTNYFVDNRDGKTYRKAKIGDQVWMAQNLNYKGPSDKDTIGSCYGNNSANCNKYGRLYTWATAMGSTEDKCGDGKNCDIAERTQGICPEGWHLPSNDEWQTLLEHADRDAKKLKSTEGWSNGGNGTDDYDFTALPGGYAEQGDVASLPDNYFKDEGVYAIFWSSTQVDDEDHTQAYRPYLKDDNKVSESNSNNYKGLGFSVRCLKDAE